MNRSVKLHGALAVCIFLFIALGLMLARPGLTDYAPYLSFSPDQDGVKGLRLLMEQQGAKVREWRLAPERLPEENGQLFVSVEPFGVTKESADRWMEWAGQGNDVVIFGSYPGWVEGWEPVYVDPEEADGMVTARFGSGVEDVYEADVATELRLERTDGAPSTGLLQDTEVLLRDEAGVLAVKQQVGAGSVTLSLTSDWLTNERILDQSHFELIWRLIGGELLRGRTVYFDEYHHGYSVSPGITQVYPMWLLAGLAQAALAAAVWLWWKGKRFGPVYTPRSFTVRRGDETLLAVAGWYRRGRLAFEALDHSVQRLNRVLQVRGGIPASPSAAQLLRGADSAAGSGRRLPDGLPELLERWESLRRTREAGGRVHYSDKDLLADSAVLEHTMNIIEEAK